MERHDSFGRALKVLIAAEAAPAGGGNIWGTVAMFAVLFGLMYLMFIRPQSKRRREAQEMQSKLGPGDKIVTIGGLYGTVESADDESLHLEVSPGVVLRFKRQAVAQVTERVGGDEPDTSGDEPATSPVQETKKAG
jgi:preprotein translocase subunit YajC